MHITVKKQPFSTETLYEAEIDGHKCWFVHDSFEGNCQIRWWEKAALVPYQLRMHKYQVPIIENIKKQLGL